jgi:hypothetical protein
MRAWNASLFTILPAIAGAHHSYVNAPIGIYEVGSTALADQQVADAAALGACRPKGMGGIMAVPAPMEFVDDDSSIARAIDAIEKSRSSIG